MKFSRFIVLYLLFTAIIGAVGWSLPYLVGEAAVLSPHFWLLFWLLFVLTGGAYAMSHFAILKGGETSILGLMGGLSLKLLASLVLIAVLLIKFPENKVITAVNFFSLYFLFTTFEVICLLRNLRDQNQT